MNANYLIIFQVASLFTASAVFAFPTTELTSNIKSSQLRSESLTISSQFTANSVTDGSTGSHSSSQKQPEACPGTNDSTIKPPQAPSDTSPSASSKPLIKKVEVKSLIKKVEVKSSVLVIEAPQEIEGISRRCKGQEATLERIAAIRDAITRLYIQRGYITSRAEMPEYLISSDGTVTFPSVERSGGTVTFPVVEGQVGRVNITDYNEQPIEHLGSTHRAYNSRYVRDRIQLGISRPLNIKRLEEQVRLLEIDPLFDENDPQCLSTNKTSPSFCSERKVDVILRPATSNEPSNKPKPGESDLIVKIPKTKFFRANFEFDNSAPPSLGAERLRADFSFANLAGRGDSLITSFQTDPIHFSTNRIFNMVGFSYQLPINPMNGTVQLRVESRREKIIQRPFDQFNFRAKADLYELVYRQPLIRSYSNEFALSLGLTVQNGQTFLFNDTPFPFGIGPDKNGVSRTSVITFGQDYIHRGVTGTWLLRSQFSVGTGLFDATSNSDSIPDGHFISWLGQVQRLQQINNDQLLIVQSDIQLSPNSLLPSQQFVIGGSQSLRGYRQNVRFGDNGFRFSLEDRITLNRDKNRKSTLQLAPFIDMGTVWNQTRNPNKLPPQKFLAGAGLALLWQPLSRVNLRLDYAIPVVNLRDRGENLQDNGVYFSINYQL